MGHSYVSHIWIVQWVKWVNRCDPLSTLIAIKVESGLDDSDNLGHFFGGSSGSHLQTKLSGCDPGITCSQKKQFHLVAK